MIFFEKSQPAPECLDQEKDKVRGDYKCGEVLDRLKADFFNKCYICEMKEPVSINVEHFRPHKGNKVLKFDWNNLFYACAHCNNTKMGNFEKLLNCTDSADKIEVRLRPSIKPFPKEKVSIDVLDEAPETAETKSLLLAVYNGTTKQKTIESANLRSRLLKDICDFQGVLQDYFNDTMDPESKSIILKEIEGHLHPASSFMAFKRWIIRDNEGLFEEFGQYLPKY